MLLFAFVGLAEAIPLLVFIALVAGVFAVLTAISNRNSKTASRLDRISRPASLVELEESKSAKKDRFGGMVEAAKAMSAPLMPQTELEQSALKIELANAGFRSESAPGVYLGIRFAFLLTALIVSCSVFVPLYGLTWTALQPIVLIVGAGYYIPQLALWYLRTSRQQEVFLSLPDALDLLVVCVESGLGLDAAMRKVCEEMSHHKALVEEFTLANFQLQMGRPRREVLHDLGVRTGVDDVKALAAILIQADRFGASIANALRVQSDSMRTRRKQIAEEKAAKTAVQLIFPLVLFIFPGIFVVLVGPAAIGIMKVMLKK
jgi:tight adherence protein C